MRTLVRRHGFVCPWGVHQVLALVLFVYLLLAFYTLTAPFLPSAASHIALQVLYGLLAVFTFGLGVAATAANPSDPGLTDPSLGTQSTGYRCSICQVYVRPRSKHCRVCNRCTEDFDHHCMWLNNCVGRANYTYFFALLCSTLLLVSTHLGVSLYLFAQSFAHRPLIQPLQLSRYHGQISMNGLRVVWALTVGTSVIFESLLLDLLSFHLVLRHKGMSTYDYILAQREAQANQPNAQHDSSAPMHQRLQQTVSCRHLGRKARVTPSEISLEALEDLPRRPQKKLRVHLNPVTAWRVNSRNANPPIAKARFSSMAEYIMPGLFAGKVPQPSPSDALTPASEPATAGPISATENPMFDVEAQTAASTQLSSSRLPALLGPVTAWSPTEINRSAPVSPEGSTFTSSQAPLTPVQPQRSTDNAVSVQPLLTGT